MFIDFLAQYYEWLKAAHVIGVICWISGMLYLPRLFVYHADAEVGSELDMTLQVMERRLLRIIMNPSMILVLVSGSINAVVYGISALGPWFHIKILCVLMLLVAHGMFAKWRVAFASGKNVHSAKFYRYINEVPSIMMVIIVIMVIIKPFD